MPTSSPEPSVASSPDLGFDASSNDSALLAAMQSVLERACAEQMADEKQPSIFSKTLLEGPSRSVLTTSTGSTAATVATCKNKRPPRFSAIVESGPDAVAVNEDHTISYAVESPYPFEPSAGQRIFSKVFAALQAQFSASTLKEKTQTVGASCAMAQRIQCEGKGYVVMANVGNTVGILFRQIKQKSGELVWRATRMTPDDSADRAGAIFDALERGTSNEKDKHFATLWCRPFESAKFPKEKFIFYNIAEKTIRMNKQKFGLAEKMTDADDWRDGDAYLNNQSTTTSGLGYSAAGKGFSHQANISYMAVERDLDDAAGEQLQQSFVLLTTESLWKAGIQEREMLSLLNDEKILPNALANRLVNLADAAGVLDDITVITESPLAANSDEPLMTERYLMIADGYGGDFVAKTVAAQFSTLIAQQRTAEIKLLTPGSSRNSIVSVDEDSTYFSDDDEDNKKRANKTSKAPASTLLGTIGLLEEIDVDTLKVTKRFPENIGPRYV